MGTCSNIIKGKTKIELPKTVDAAELSLEEVKEILERKAPKKKTAKKATGTKKTSAKKTTRKKTAVKKK